MCALAMPGWKPSTSPLRSSRIYCCPSWPALRKYVWTLGSCFCLREVELSCIMLHEIELDDWNSLVTISLSVSKTDQYARGCKRTIGSAAAPKSRWFAPTASPVSLSTTRRSCWVCSMGQPQQRTFRWWGRRDASKVVQKEAMRWLLFVKTLDTSETKKGWLKDTADTSLVSGHSLMRSGVKHWVKAGVPEELIMFLTCHSSLAVKAYIEDAREASPVVRNQIAERQGLQSEISCRPT